MNGMKRYILGLTIVTVLIAAFPTVYAVVRTPDDMTYSGRHMQNTGDYGVYYSQMEQARQGHLLFKNLYTSEPHERSIFNPVWLTLGWAARVTGISTPITFHLLRLLLIPIYILVAARLVRQIVDDPGRQPLALVMIVFAGGIGGYAQTTDASVFQALMFSPHLILSLTLLCGIVGNILILEKRFSLRLSCATGILTAVIFIFHPYHISTVYGLLGGYLVIQCIRRQPVKNLIFTLLTITAISLPSIGYHWWFFDASPIGSAWLAQSDRLMNPKSPWTLLAGFAPLALLAGVGIRRMFSMRNDSRWFLLVWMIAPLVLMWIPWFFRMRVSGAWSIPVALCAAEGVWWILHHASLRRSLVYQTLIAGIVIVMLVPMHVRTFALNVSAYREDVPLAYLPDDFVSVMVWYREHTTDEDVLVSSWYTGNILPGFTGRTVYGGHGVQTLYPEEKGAFIDTMYSTTDVEVRRELLRRGEIDYVLVSPFERALGIQSVMDEAGLEEVFRSGEYRLYTVL